MTNLPPEIEDAEFAEYAAKWRDFILKAQAHAKTKPSDNLHMAYEHAQHGQSYVATLHDTADMANIFLTRAIALAVLDFKGDGLNAQEKEALRESMVSQQRRFKDAVDHTVADLSRQVTLVQSALKAFARMDIGK